ALANDYFILPITPQEIVARIKALYTKFRPALVSLMLTFEDVTMNLATYEVRRSKKLIRLGPTEFKILQCLMEFPQKTLSREYIMEYVWGSSPKIEPRTIDVHINRLRNALK